MSHRLFIRTGAVTAAASLALLAAGPALAAAPVAQGTANALTANIASQVISTGTYAAQNDGTTETTSGSNSPTLNALSNQTLLTAGTASQDAKTSISGSNGLSAACASIAGSGSSLVSTGVGASCLTGGSALSLDAGNIDLSNVTLTQGQLLSNVSAGANGSTLLSTLIPQAATLQDLLNQIGTALDPATATVDELLQAVLGPVSTQVLAPLLTATGISVGLDLGAVYSSCQATPTTATGAGTVASLGLTVGLPSALGGPLTIPVQLGTGENVKVLTNLDQVVTAVEEALTGALTGAVTGNTITSQLDPVISQVNGGITTLVDALNDNLISVIEPQLAPLEENVLDGTLNKVERRDSGRTIDVTALDLQVLPAASAFTPDNSSLVGLTAAHVICGPNTRVGTTTTAVDTDDSTTTTSTSSSDTPTTVESGIGSLEDGPSALALAALAGLAVVGTGAGVVGFRRALRHH
ncbi:hypothetical protein [Nocardioides sp. Kera G14]|uniref:hypothetical protein n=1 Tax=Nocardioides sp. Kera G14 TaxID=2884264 RepID=UPI001D0FF358|nr:hypothetical protein [Nocardioides sp. Kera G14]UDY24436.1 hypothetical protein LH076_03790 [Nocardioides sp. Kera G14]